MKPIYTAWSIQRTPWPITAEVVVCLESAISRIGRPMHGRGVASVLDSTTRWQSLIVDETGQTQMGAILSSPHRSNPIPVQVWTTRGVQTVQGHFSPYSHLPGGLLLVPEGLGTILGAEF